MRPIDDSLLTPDERRSDPLGKRTTYGYDSRGYPDLRLRQDGTPDRGAGRAGIAHDDDLRCRWSNHCVLWLRSRPRTR
jgi:hypothetical protein